MKGETLFEKMTDISDEYIAEAALVPTANAVPPRKAFTALSRFLNSGWGVASVCFVVAIAVVIGMVAWGQLGNMVSSSIPATPNAPLWQRFEFSYTITDGAGQPLQTHVSPGDEVLVDTTLTNRGLPFFYVGSSSEYCAYAQFVLQGNESVTIDGGIFHTTDVGTFPVLSGEVGQGQYSFTIPENATLGVYDLVLSYKDTKQVFSGVLTVGESTEPPIDTIDHPFSFGYELPDDAMPGDTVRIPTWVINDGEAFTFEGASNGFAPHAVLTHMETQYRIECALPVTGNWVTFEVHAGQKGERIQTFLIPADAPVGAYALTLSFQGAVSSFPGVLIVGNFDLIPLPPVENDHPFSFGYQSLPYDTLFAIPGDRILVDAWVVNEGDAFTFEGSSSGFFPNATLVHMENGYTIEGLIVSHSDFVSMTVQSGQKGTCTPEFFIPTNAPTGEYALVLSFGTASLTFINVLTVAIP